MKATQIQKRDSENLSFCICSYNSLPVGFFPFFFPWRMMPQMDIFLQKFSASESIHSGHLPLWNPYINFGLPQYGDMSSGYWNPVTRS